MSLYTFEKDLKARKFINSKYVKIENSTLSLSMELNGAGFKLVSKLKLHQAKLFLGSVATFVLLYGDSLDITTIDICADITPFEFRQALEQANYHRALLSPNYEFRVPEEWFTPRYENYLDKAL